MKMPSPQGPTVDDSTREKARALFTFLKEFTELRTRTIRSLEQYERVIWFYDLPRQDGCDCIAWHLGQEISDPEIWLEVHKPQLYPPPALPHDLQGWLNREEIENSSLDMPELRQSISVRVENNESGEGRFEERQLDDHPHIRKLWET